MRIRCDESSAGSWASKMMMAGDAEGVALQVSGESDMICVGALQPKSNIELLLLALGAPDPYR